MQIQQLAPSERLLVIFIGHGSPLNVIETNEFRPQWEALGADFSVQGPWRTSRNLASWPAWLIQAMSIFRHCCMRPAL